MNEDECDVALNDAVKSGLLKHAGDDAFALTDRGRSHAKALIREDSSMATMFVGLTLRPPLERERMPKWRDNLKRIRSVLLPCLEADSNFIDLLRHAPIESFAAWLCWQVDAEENAPFALARLIEDVLGKPPAKEAPADV
jgi:hypothetical protein